MGGWQGGLNFFLRKIVGNGPTALNLFLEAEEKRFFFLGADFFFSFFLFYLSFLSRVLPTHPPIIHQRYVGAEGFFWKEKIPFFGRIYESFPPPPYIHTTYYTLWYLVQRGSREGGGEKVMCDITVVCSYRTPLISQ